jgi:cysteinyl-tRNA synthetase
MHIGLLTVNGEKMSKSLGNIINVKDLLQKWDPEVIRLFLSQAHYRSPPDFNEKALEDSKKGLIRVHRLKEKLESLSDDLKIDNIDEESLSKIDKFYFSIIDEFKCEFEKAMDDDFNTPLAVSSIFEFVNKSNKYFEENQNPNNKLGAYGLGIFLKLCNILTLFQPSIIESKDDNALLEKVQDLVLKYKKDVKDVSIESLIKILLEIRQNARDNKDWNTADAIRNELDRIGFEIQDTSQGAVWRKK